ncbi:MAG: hypothetical protein KAR62_04625 [Sphingomonadales bacterium]|nr:hypothetical protein [Sphingomonadales bacterium]
MLKTSFIKLFSILGVGLFGSTSLHAQEVDNLALDMVALAPLVLSLEQADEKNQNDIWFKGIQLPNNQGVGLYIRHREDDASLMNSVELDFPLEHLSWISVIPTALMADLADGFLLDGVRRDKYLHFNVAPEPLGTIAEIVESFAEEEMLLDGEVLSEEEMHVIDDFAFISAQPSPPERFVNVTRASLWRLYPHKLLEQLRHLGVTGVYIKIPSSLNGSFPLNPIELERFITLATAKNIRVYASIEDDLLRLADGASKSETQLSELVNYNGYVPFEAQLSGVQINILWREIESYVFYKNNWFLQASDLYASLSVENDILSVDLLLPAEMLSELNNDNIFKRLAVVAGSVTIKVTDVGEKEITEILNPLSLWAEENNKEYRVALEQKDQMVSVSGWLQPEGDGSSAKGNVRMLAMGNWAVLMKVDGINTEIGAGFNFMENNLADVTDITSAAAKMFYTVDLLDMEQNINEWQRLDHNFKGVTLYQLPDMSEK